MKNGRWMQPVAAAALLACTVPALATTPAPTMDQTRFHALSTLANEPLVSLTDEELSTVQGGFFNFGPSLGFNIAVMPQINICIFCFDTTQMNNGLIIGSNFFK